jgi:hypothetical protein
VLLGFQPTPILGGRGNAFCAFASITGMVAYTTAAGTGGPLLYNGGPTGHGGVTAYVMAVSYGLSVASAAAGAIGLTGGITTAPSTTTAITAQSNLTLNQSATSVCTAYSVGTVSTAGTLFMPTGQIGTAPLTAEIADDNFIHLGGVLAVPPGYFAAVSASTVLTTSVIQVGLVWVEVANT